MELYQTVVGLQGVGSKQQLTVSSGIKWWLRLYRRLIFMVKVICVLLIFFFPPRDVTDAKEEIRSEDYLIGGLDPPEEDTWNQLKSWRTLEWGKGMMLAFTCLYRMSLLFFSMRVGTNVFLTNLNAVFLWKQRDDKQRWGKLKYCGRSSGMEVETQRVKIENTEHWASLNDWMNFLL